MGKILAYAPVLWMAGSVLDAILLAEQQDGTASVMTVIVSDNAISSPYSTLSTPPWC